MKIAFVFDEIILQHEPLGVMTIAALLQAHGHTVEYFRMGPREDWARSIERVRAFGPGMLGASASTGVHIHYAEYFRQFRRQAGGVFAVIGGPHATFFPEFLEEHRDAFDALCVGEGEFPMLELAEALEAGSDPWAISNWRFILPDGTTRANPPRPFLQDLDALPLPDRTFADRFPELQAKRTGFLIAGRGCPYDCAFCFNHRARDIAEGRYVRFRSPARVIEELRQIKFERRCRFVSFQDDTFTLNKPWLLEFADLYAREIDLPYMAHIRADRVDAEIADALARSRCVRACMGLESGSDQIRNEIMGKRVTSAQIREAAAHITRRGIQLVTQNMFGVPGETALTALETVGLNVECRPSIMNLCYFQPYPGTRLGRRAAEEGLWDGNLDSIDDSYHWRMSLSLPEAERIGRIASLSHLFVDQPWLWRALAPALRRGCRPGAGAAIDPLLRGLGWFERITALTPLRGHGSRYHEPELAPELP